MAPLLMLALAAGCDTVTIVDHVHVPTAGVQQGWRLDAPSLRGFTCDGVVISPRFVRAGQGQLTVSLLLASASPSPKPLALTALTLTGPEGEALHQRPLKIVAPVDQPAEGFPVHTGRVDLATLPAAPVEEASKDGPLRMELGLVCGQPGQMSFLVHRREGVYLETRGVSPQEPARSGG